MTMRMSKMTVCGVVGVLAAAGLAQAQVFSANLTRPGNDRWYYPFNFAAGQETRAALFAAIREPQFDDRDSEFVVAWQTGAQVPTERGAASYRIVAARAKVTIQSTTTANVFYDPTFDSVRTSYALTDPDYTPDADPGKPFEIFGAGYRNGVTAASFFEAIDFGCLGEEFAGCRSVFAATYDTTGTARDIARHVRERFEAPPWAIGRTDTVPVGQPLPVNTELTFDINLCEPGVRRYLQEGLDAGRVTLIFTSLHPAIGGPGGGGGGDYARVYTDENPQGPSLGRGPKLEIDVRVFTGADYNGDATTDFFDYLDFVAEFAAESPAADFNNDCTVDFFDYLDFADEFSRG
jgi:hypothetical protein